jgi:hypothetical protein
MPAELGPRVIARCIMTRALFMVRPVDLNDEPHFGASEVDDVLRDDELPPKPKAGLGAREPAPNPLLRARSEDPPLPWTPREARECARSVSWRDGNAGSSRRSSRRRPYASARLATAASGKWRDLDLNETSLREWAKQVDIDAGKGPPEALTTAERDELAKLRKQVKRLEMEREILKKAATFFAKENE